jgi:hypothetical protein
MYVDTNTACLLSACIMLSYGHLQAYVEAVVKNFSDYGVPLDRVVLEPGWQGKQYQWNPGKYPDVPGMIKTIAPTQVRTLRNKYKRIFPQLNELKCTATHARGAHAHTHTRTHTRTFFTMATLT